MRNAGVGGEICSATLARLRSELASDRPDLVVWQVGTNDAVGGVDIDEFRAALEAGVAAARAERVSIILVDPQFYFGIKNSLASSNSSRSSRTSGRDGTFPSSRVLR